MLAIIRLLQANKSLLEQYKQVTIALSNNETDDTSKEDIERVIDQKLEDEFAAMSKRFSKEIQQNLNEQNSHSFQELDGIKANSAKLEVRLKQHIDDCAKKYESMTSDIQKSQRSTPSSSEDLPVDRWLMKDPKDTHKYLRRIDTEGKGIASNDSLDILHPRFINWQEEVAEQIDSLKKKTDDLQRKSSQLENFTRDYNRRSSEIDIVYDRIKAQMEALKKESEHIQSRANKAKDANSDIADIRIQLAELSAKLKQKASERDTGGDMASGTTDNNVPTDLKSLLVVESRVILLEQMYKFRLNELEAAVKSLSRTSRDGEKNDNGKRPRSDHVELGPSEVISQMDKQEVQINELMAFLEPLRSTVLGTPFAENLQTSMNQLISVARRHERDIDNIHTALKQITHVRNIDHPNKANQEVETTLEAHFSTHERRMTEKNTLIMETLEDLKSSFTKSEEKQQRQQIEIDQLQQQLVATSSLLQKLQDACSQSGIFPNEMKDQ
ncbi:hypothetical protein VKS41_006860 [Umbelopsis sp. WA50703]